MAENMEHTHEEMREQYWRLLEPTFRQIQEIGLAKYFASVDLAKAFALKDRDLRCMDEGTVGGVHLAGAGILNQSAAAEFIKEAGVEGIYSHAGCGAAALYAKQQGLELTEADEYGIAWAKELSERAGVPYRGHTEANEMARPPEFHIARVAYYDGTGQFDPSPVDDLPPGFVISRRYLEPAYAKQEAEIAVAIALGEHGFGEKFTPEAPFYLVAIGDGRPGGVSADVLQKEANEIAQRHKGTVITGGFIAPLA